MESCNDRSGSMKMWEVGIMKDQCTLYDGSGSM